MSQVYLRIDGNCPPVKNPSQNASPCKPQKRKKEKEKLQHIKQCKEEGEMNMIERRNRRN